MSEPPHDEVSPDAAVASEDADARAYRVKLPMFEGPLDLLLHLIQKHELNILDIPIGFVAQKYVEYIRLMEEMSIDLASEYLVMAATLAHIKSRSLLPPDPTQETEEATEEEEEDPRAELIRKLLEYQKYKHAADNLGQREVLGRDVFSRGFVPDPTEEEAPLAPMSLFKLVDAFEGLLKRAKQVQEHQIDFEKLSISDRIGQIVERLRSVRMLSFEQLFDGDVTRAEMIVTFLALLEMTKLRMTRLAQDGPLAPIVVELVLSADQVKDFNVERAFEQVYEAVEQDFAADLPEPTGAGSVSVEEWDEAEGAGLELDDEELAAELHRAARELASGQEQPPLHRSPSARNAPNDGDGFASDDLGPADQLSTFGPPEEDDFVDDLGAEEDIPVAIETPGDAPEGAVASVDSATSFSETSPCEPELAFEAGDGGVPLGETEEDALHHDAVAADALVAAIDDVRAANELERLEEAPASTDGVYAPAGSSPEAPPIDELGDTAETPDGPQWEASSPPPEAFDAEAPVAAVAEAPPVSVDREGETSAPASPGVGAAMAAEHPFVDLGPLEAEAAPREEVAGLEHDAGDSEGAVARPRTDSEAEEARPTTERETKGNVDTPQQGSQDPKGSDVDSP